MIKATNHRKRHVPTGPCGIWFQTQHQQHQQQQHHQASSRTGNTRAATGTTTTSSTQEEDATISQNEPLQRKPLMDMSFSPAWSCMQQELNWITPYLPSTMTDPFQRYQHIRPHLSREYTLLLELQRGDYDRFDQPLMQTLLVLVASVEAQIHIWTVQLKDETGCTIQAWMEPRWVQQQWQENSQSIIRPGVVWRLNQVGMTVVQVEEERLERMLLIRGSAIVQVWTPEQYGAADSPEQQRQFLEWMEKRKALPLVGISEKDDNDNDDDDDNDNDEAHPPEDDCFLEENMTINDGNSHDHGHGSDTFPPRQTNHPEEDLDNEDVMFDGSNPIWNVSPGPQTSNSSQASSRPVTQAFSQPWSRRPRLDDAIIDETTLTASESVVHTQENIPFVEPTNHTEKMQTETTMHNSIHCSTGLRTNSVGNRATNGENPSVELPNKPEARQSQAEQISPTSNMDPKNGATQDQGTTQPMAAAPATAVVTATVSKKSQSPNWQSTCENSAFWNAMLDEDDESDNDSGTANLSNSAGQKPTSKETDEPQKNLKRDQDDGEDSEVEEIDQDTIQSPSMFDTSNFGNIDFGTFSDDDDDDAD